MGNVLADLTRAVSKFSSSGGGSSSVEKHGSNGPQKVTPRYPDDESSPGSSSNTSEAQAKAKAADEADAHAKQVEIERRERERMMEDERILAEQELAEA